MFCLKLISWLRDEKNTDIVIIALGIISSLAVILSVIINGLHNGDMIYPATQTSSVIEVVEIEQGTLYLRENNTTQADEQTDDGVYSSLIININEASVEELMLLPNIGQTRAEAIIEYRELNNGFASVDELLEVSGIGEKTYNAICGSCTVEGPRLQYRENDGLDGN